MRAAITALVVLLGAPATATEPPACLEQAVRLLQKHDPDGYEVYRKSTAEFFGVWLSCDSPTFGLSAAVHESVHGLGGARGSRYRFYLPGGELRSVRFRRTFDRDVIGRYLTEGEKDQYYGTYLTGTSGAQDLRLLLDELNAYTHGLTTATRLVGEQGPGTTTSARDGLVTFLYYLELYLRHARTVEPRVWARLRQGEQWLRLIDDLWRNAERALLESAPHRSLGIADGPRLRKVYAAAQIGELQQLFGGTAIAFRFDPQVLARLGRDAPDRPANPEPRSATTIQIGGRTMTMEEAERAAETDPALRRALDVLRRHGQGGGVIRLGAQRSTTITVNGRVYTREELEEGARTDPVLRQALEALQARDRARD